MKLLEKFQSRCGLNLRSRYHMVCLFVFKEKRDLNNFSMFQVQCSQYKTFISRTSAMLGLFVFYASLNLVSNDPSTNN